MAKGLPKEVEALGVVLAALNDLDETQQRWVIASAMSNLRLTPIGTPASPKSTITGAPSNAGQSFNGDVSAKDFLRAKSPQTDVQRIACLGYYLSTYRSQPHFKTKDLTALNIEAAGTKMSNPSQAVGNAYKQNHYLAPAGGGKKQITAFGEEVVEALPDQEAVKAVEQKKPKKRKARRKGEVDKR